MKGKQEETPQRVPRPATSAASTWGPFLRERFSLFFFFFFF